MNKYRSSVVADLHRTIFVIGFLIIAFVGFFYLTKSAEMQSSSVSLEQNLVLGRLAFGTLVGTFSGPQLYIRTANADGTGVVTLTSSIPPSTEPTWSPDGTKIAYISSSANADIYVMNSNGTNQVNLTNTMGVNESNPSWSAPGKIVYERGGQIWTMNADGTNQIQFVGITQPTPTAPAWSADGSKIAFVSGGEIWKINADGTNERRVTINTTADTNPSWSPDGAKIVFAKGTNGITIINEDGTDDINLTGVVGDAAPAWSPDGTTIAFRRNAAPNGIYLMDVTGGNQVRIIADSQTTPSIFETNDNPAWQPVAQTPNTVTISGRIINNNIGLNGVTVNLSGTTNATATTDAAGNYQISGLASGGSYTLSPSFAGFYFTPPNRSFSNLTSNQIADFVATGVCVGGNCAKNGQIAFVRDNEIFMMNSDGTSPMNLTNNPATDTSPNFSPDGANIIFSTNRDGNNEIYRMRSDGSNLVRLTNNAASETSPYYSPDGSMIVFISNRDGNSEIYKMNADGANQVRLTNDAALQNVPAFSPDGQKIIFVTSATASPMKLWSMNADGSNQQQFPDSNQGGNFYNRPSYSPDGTKVVHKCCFSTFAEGIYTVNADGNTGSSLRITTGQFDDLPDWQPIIALRRTAFDFDGDGRSDISVFRPTDKVWYLLRSQAGFTSLEFGLSDDVLAPADYDGDLKTDIAVWRGSSGDFYVLNSFNNTWRVENFGLSGDVPAPSDWDGDGKADLSVYRGGAQGTFYYRGSMGNPNGNITSISWGISGDKPVSSDFDGDGKTDAAIYRPSNGVWYVRRSTDSGLTAVNFGLANDTLVPADYDADGKTDFAVYRGGIWYILRSLQGFTAFQYGLSSDTPAPADYDGDGRADAAVYRNGVWYVLKTQSGATEITTFGLGGDKPIPSAYVR